MTAGGPLEQFSAIFRGAVDCSVLRTWSKDEWLALVALANQHRLLPALHCALARGRLVEVLPEEARAYLELITKLNEERNTALRQEIQDILSVLNQAEIEPMLLKGAVILMEEPCRVEGRMVGDVDLLIPRMRESDAVHALKAAGFHRTKHYGSAARSIADLCRDRNRACIDLHRELMNPPFRRALAAADLFVCADRLTENSRRWLVPSLQHRAIHAILQGRILEQNCYCRRLCLRSAREITSLAPSLDWSAIEAWADRHRVRNILEATVLSASYVFGLRWPLSKPPAQSAMRHHEMACTTEKAGRWDIGIGVGARVRETFAADRLAAAYGTHGCYAAKALRQCFDLVSRHSARALLQRLTAT